MTPPRPPPRPKIATYRASDRWRDPPIRPRHRSNNKPSRHPTALQGPHHATEASAHAQTRSLRQAPHRNLHLPRRLPSTHRHPRRQRSLRLQHGKHVSLGWSPRHLSPELQPLARLLRQHGLHARLRARHLQRRLRVHGHREQPHHPRQHVRAQPLLSRRKARHPSPLRLRRRRRRPAHLPPRTPRRQRHRLGSPTARSFPLSAFAPSASAASASTTASPIASPCAPNTAASSTSSPTTATPSPAT